MSRSDWWFSSALALALLVLEGVGAGGAAAQPDRRWPGAAPLDAYLQRQLRTLERPGTSPDSAGILLRRTQRDLISQGRGVYLTPEQATFSAISTGWGAICSAKS